MPARAVLLASLPLTSSRYPNLGLGLLKAAVLRLGIACNVRYYSLNYLQDAGRRVYSSLSDLKYGPVLLGEWAFAGAAHGQEDVLGESDSYYLAEVWRPRCPERQYVSRLLDVLTARETAPAFIDKCVAQEEWENISILGISTSFQQNMASLAFARRVKDRFPHVFIVFGGANCQGEMGIELHRQYGFIDAVCLGEGDEVFPELVRRHLAGESPEGLPGIVLRASDGSSIIPAIEVQQIEDLDRLPYPDLSDFYEQRRALPIASQIPPAVMYETARGCWWGAKHHCTFCGINGRMMAYRSKSQKRAYDELAHLVTRYGNRVVNADAILDMRYFEEFLPRLAEEGPDVTMFWQMKANMRPEHLTTLSRAGVRHIQPGIEALDTALLTLMRKGCTMLQNVQILKLAAENGIWVAWNLLYGFPGEDPGSYQRSAELIPMLRHLQPPFGTGDVYADRFSPYFQRPEAFGVSIEPVAAYRFVYPFDEAVVRRLAYHFEMRSEALDRIEDTVAAMRAEQRLWNAHQQESALYSHDLGPAVIVHDERWGWPRAVHEFTGAEAEVLRLCWRITSWNQTQAELRGTFSAPVLDAAIDTLQGHGILLREGAEFLSLPLRQPGWRRAPRPQELAQRTVVPYALQTWTSASNRSMERHAR